VYTSGSDGTLNSEAQLDETRGGTGTGTYATGDILYASGVNTLGKLAAGSNGDVLTLAAGVPTWAAGGAFLDQFRCQHVSNQQPIFSNQHPN
jgi:hypothetical protein